MSSREDAIKLVAEQVGLAMEAKTAVEPQNRETWAKWNTEKALDAAHEAGLFVWADEHEDKLAELTRQLEAARSRSQHEYFVTITKRMWAAEAELAAANAKLSRAQGFWPADPEAVERS